MHFTSTELFSYVHMPVTHAPKKQPFMRITKGLKIIRQSASTVSKGAPVCLHKVAQVPNFQTRNFTFCGLERDAALCNNSSHTLPKSKHFDSCGVALTSVDCQSNLLQPHPHGCDEEEGCGTFFFSLSLFFCCCSFKFDLYINEKTTKKPKICFFEGFNLGNHTHYSSLILQSPSDNTLDQQAHIVTLLTPSIFPNKPDKRFILHHAVCHTYCSFCCMHTSERLKPTCSNL